MKPWFQRRGYPEDVTSTEMKKVIFNVNSVKSSNKSEGVPFVLTYHPLLKKVNSLIRKHSFTWMTKLKKCFNRDLWYRFEAPET